MYPPLTACAGCAEAAALDPAMNGLGVPVHVGRDVGDGEKLTGDIDRHDEAFVGISAMPMAASCTALSWCELAR